jgi:4'-phosphopantetheinyl transferase
MTRGKAAIWRIDLGEAAPAATALLPLLSVAERQRAPGFARTADREAFVRAHAALRLLLSASLGRPPASIPFGVPEPEGKPRVEPQVLGGKTLDFSLSHSGSSGVIGIVQGGGTIGVDLEARGAPADWRALADRHFTADERRWLLAQPTSKQGFRFLQIWTRKEAYLKAIGKGFSRNPAAFRSRLDSDGAVVGSAFDPAGRLLPQWRVVPLDRSPVAACAILDFDPGALPATDFDWRAAETGR